MKALPKGKLERNRLVNPIYHTYMKALYLLCINCIYYQSSQLLKIESFEELERNVVPNHDDRGSSDGSGLIDGHLYDIAKEF